MTEIQLYDAKGDYWNLTFGACQLNKRDGMWYALWYTDESCPGFLFKNGSRYCFIPTPIFTRWFTPGTVAAIFTDWWQ